MLKVPRLSVSMQCPVSCSMSCSISVMRTMFLLVAMLMMSSVSGRTVENFWDEGDAVLPSDDVINNVRRQDTDTVLCGRRPAVTSKRHVGDEPTDDGDNSDQLDKLIGAHYVTRGEVPWQVGLYSRGHIHCSGAILNEFWVVTTAVCVYGHDTLTVVVGDHHLGVQESGQQRFQTAAVHIRGPFAGVVGNYDYDLALIRIANTSDGRGIRFNNYVQPICLPETEDSPAIGTQLTISGWGQINRHDDFTNVLMKMELPVFNHTVCKNDIYEAGKITDRMICAGPRYTMAAACYDDNGDPATYKSGDFHILAGLVTSVLDYCQLPARPVILTSIPDNLQWINNIITYFSSNNQGVLPSRT